MPTMGPIRGSEKAQAITTHHAAGVRPIHWVEDSVCADTKDLGS